MEIREYVERARGVIDAAHYAVTYVVLVYTLRILLRAMTQFGIFDIYCSFCKTKFISR